MSKQENVGEQLKNLDAPAVPVKTPEALLTPESQAATNAMISAAIRGVFEQLGPMLEKMALTPEKLAESERLRRAPDPAVIARELRERKLMAADLEDAERQKAANQSACPHAYPTGQAAWHVVRNYPDRNPRYTCPLCSCWVTPREWRIGAPDAENPRGRAYIAPEHPLYREASKILASKGGN